MSVRAPAQAAWTTREAHERASEPTRILFGSAKRHAYPLVLGPYSVHTNARSLAQGTSNIRNIGDALRATRRI